MRVLVFGDSITQGFLDSQGGWVARLAADYNQEILADQMGEWTMVFNLGVSGDTLRNVMDRFENETKVREPDEELVLVFAVGINDAILRDNRAQLDVYDLEKDLAKLIDNARKLTEKILFVGLTAVDELLTNPYPQSSSGKQFTNNRINLFEDCIKQVALRHEIPFVPVFDHMTMLLGKGAALLADGLHPNDKGHELIHMLVKPELEKLLKVPVTPFESGA